ncbi:TIGR02569 family protein [Corynebacterium sp. zg-331]|uniref:TIGR02569 family protein n=1 Tax=unclassified Corynebacterium TaxID=2624378 RepID=UPI00128AFFAC|nr:TIGR02569 family protein [Corynebacterium sp. zg-331]
MNKVVKTAQSAPLAPRPERLPEQVAAVFHAADGEPVPLGSAWDHGWRIGDVVLSRAVGPHVAWSARVRDRLSVPGLTVARPVRSTDGRFVAGGWRASTFVPGHLVQRVDETVVAALRLEAALVSVEEQPDTSGDDIFSVADRCAWSPDVGAVDMGLKDARLREVIQALRAAREEVSSPVGIGHADMLGTTVYAEGGGPALTDLVGVVRPHGYTAAQTMVDALLIGATDAEVFERFSHVPDLDQLAVRAVLYRAYVDAQMEGVKSNIVSNLEGVARLVLTRLSATL